MPKTKVLLGDLTHTAQGISAMTFPLGASFITAYAKQQLGDHFEFDLLKFPEIMARRILEDQPKVLALSSYSWNLQINYKLVQWAKSKIPGLIAVLGGPNFPVASDEKKEFLTDYPAIDFYVENEGEIGFVDTLTRLLEHDLNAKRLKQSHTAIGNCSYVFGDDLVEGKIERILDINTIPSPYLSGVLDKFFDDPLVPMLETARGCPFSCAFCADGLASKNRVTRFDFDRTRDELDYIAERIRHSDELIVTDLNFGMYKQDKQTAEYIAELRGRQRRWPVVLKGSAGKNQPDRIIEVARILDGAWLIGSAVQSTDPEVLANIKRSNISLDAYRKFVDTVNANKTAQSYTEIILALPGDTKQKHFASLRTGIDNKVGAVRMYQAMLLSGTDMATRETRERFKLQTKVRIIPGNIGVYTFGDDQFSIAETEEIIVGSKDMTFEEYAECRVMNLLIETYINNGLFEEVFSAVAAMGLSRFDVLIHLLEHREMFSDRMREIVASFIEDTVSDLYESKEEAQANINRPEIMLKYEAGELGNNELLAHRAMLYLEFDDIAEVLNRTVKMFLKEKGHASPEIDEYFDELKAFIVCRKKEIHVRMDRYEQRFRYDFKEIEEKNFEVDPRQLAKKPDGTRIQFFHDEHQKRHIANSYELYKNHPGGLGRMIQRSNLKLMYRQFERA